MHPRFKIWMDSFPELEQVCEEIFQAVEQLTQTTLKRSKTISHGWVIFNIEHLEKLKEGEEISGSIVFELGRLTIWDDNVFPSFKIKVLTGI